MTKHTPSPWGFEQTGDHKRYIIGKERSTWGTNVAEVYSDDTDQGEAAANARLIAAAPELLKALGAMYEAFRFTSHNKAEDAANALAKAAIAKVEGE